MTNVIGAAVLGIGLEIALNWNMIDINLDTTHPQDLDHARAIRGNCKHMQQRYTMLS